MVSVAKLRTIESEKSISLLPGNYDEAKARKIGDEAVIPLEAVQLGNVKDEAVKAEAKAKVETSLVDNTKSFIGFKIANLYDFFMLFVVMSGVSAVILFLLSKRLLVMMHGVR
jgi:POT family proton-dependent oligopeptide transporter